MTTKYTNIITLAAAALLFTACNGFLEDPPKLSQSTEITLSSYDGLNKATQAAYGPLYSSNWYGEDAILEGEMKCGNGYRKANGDFQSNRYNTEYNWNYSADNTSGLWGTAYYTISAVNNVLANLEGKEGGSVTLQDLANLRAECLFIRALAHFDLVRLYAQPYSYQPDGIGVPVVLKTDPTGKPARNTTREVYSQIVEDLTEAEEIIDPEYRRQEGTDPTASATIYAIQALLARVYANMEDWNSAAAYATEVINSGIFRLWTAEEYPNVWSKDYPALEGTEVIFEVYGNTSNNYYGGYEQTEYMTNPSGYADCAMSEDIMGMFDASDVRGGLIRTDKNEKSGLWWTTKYVGKKGTQPDCANSIILRLSEMYLLRAEAAQHGATSESTALDDYNAVTVARGNAAKSVVTLKEIQDEFRKEFVYEGHYFFDLARWQQGVTRTHFSGNPLYQNMPFPDYHWALPIAQSELEVNENLVQNEGWK